MPTIGGSVLRQTELIRGRATTIQDILQGPIGPFIWERRPAHTTGVVCAGSCESDAREY
jgi:hypothetical protein